MAVDPDAEGSTRNLTYIKTPEPESEVPPAAAMSILPLEML
jgi:hypothetical protein